MLDIDFAEHNASAKEIWDNYLKGTPTKVPVTIYADVRNWLAEPSENTQNLTMNQYLKSPQLMLETQVKTKEWIKHNILSDEEMGYPKDGWDIIVDFQNFVENVWFGGTMVPTDEPHTDCFVLDDDKYAFLKKPIPKFDEGIGTEVLRYYEHFINAKKSGFTYKNCPINQISMPYNMLGTDGPFTLACEIRGTEAFIMDMMDDPDYAKELLFYITEATISRIKAIRSYLDLPKDSSYFGFADDSIVMLSPELYQEFVLPVHRKIYNELGACDAPRSIHLCGDAQRFFPILQKELNVMSFDTGFPIQFSRLYDELSPETTICGGPHIGILLTDTRENVFATCQSILRSGVMEKSKKFILREGNALAPRTPLANVNAIFQAREKFGVYQ